MLPLIIIIGIIIGIICVVSNISQKRKYDKNQLSIADTEIEDNIFTSIWEEEPEDWEDPSHDPIMKPNAERAKYHDNVNYMVFQGNGVFSKTGRKRTIKPIKAFSYDEAIAILIEQGFIPDSIQIERCCPEPPTEGQLVAMRDHDDIIPPYICKHDASCIIDRYMYEDDFAGKELLNFATTQRIPISYYMGKESLLSYLWNIYDDKHRIALYMVFVKKKEYDKWDFENFEKYTSEAMRLMKNQTFIKSFNQIHGVTNILKQTNCYKMVLSLII